MSRKYGVVGGKHPWTDSDRLIALAIKRRGISAAPSVEVVPTADAEARFVLPPPPLPAKMTETTVHKTKKKKTT